jgi:hypothetical protein
MHQPEMRGILPKRDKSPPGISSEIFERGAERDRSAQRCAARPDSRSTSATTPRSDATHKALELTSAGTTHTATSRSRQAESVKSATAESHTAIAACQAAEQTKPNKEPPAHESAPGPAADLSGTLLLDVRHEGSACDKPSYSTPHLPALRTVTAAASQGGPSSQPSPEPHALLALATILLQTTT